MSRSEVFLAHVPDERRLRFMTCPDLEARLEHLVEVARAAWSELHVPDSEFVAFLGRCLSEDVAHNLAALRADDLYLACAYGRGVLGAHEAFEQYCMRHVRAALQRVPAPVALVADVEQDLRQRLVEMQQPRPGQKCYSGRGELTGWLCVTALRDARHKLKQKGREQPLVSMEELFIAPDEDAETAFLRKTYKPELTRAFQDAVASLTSEERNLLRYHFIKNMTIDEIGRIYGVHRATAARRINRARELLCTRTQENFRARIPIDTLGYKDLLPLIESQIRIQLATMRHELDHGALAS
ncbi:MAG TPA: sigma-70 family RNA polymerase sigma factor [Polyangium sp.]|nr:sigma-70 family RNA polymerase sigma factor [Polyangium sp.]